MLAIIMLIYLAIGSIFASAFCYISKDNSGIVILIFLWPIVALLLLLFGIFYLLIRIGEIIAVFIEKFVLKRK